MEVSIHSNTGYRAFQIPNQCSLSGGEYLLSQISGRHYPTMERSRYVLSEQSPDHNCCFHEHLLQSLCCSSTFAGLHISGSDFDIVHLAQSPQILYECMAGQSYAHSPKEWQLTNSVNSLVIDVPLFCVNCSLLIVKPINRESLPIDRRHSNIASESIPFGGELLKSYRERSSHRRRVK